MRALLSVANRDGIAALARDLLALDVEIFATDGTRDYLAARGGPGRLGLRVDRGASPIVGGQVKTFHHAIYAGILARRDIPAQLDELREQGIGLIDLVVVNVKPFAPAIGVKLIGLDEAIEMIDVGGAALLGAAARNAAGVAAASDPSHYPIITRGTARARHGQRRRPARGWPPKPSAPWPPTTPRSPPTSTRSPATRSRAGSRSCSRRWTTCATARTHTNGPRSIARRPTGAGRVADATRLQGDLPSFNNLLDLDAAYRIARDYTAPTVAIVKHTDPVGLASHDELVEAYRHAVETDPVAAFGGIVAVNRELDGATAREIAANSYEGGRGARLQPVGAGHPARQARAGTPGRPARPDRGDARLRDRQPRLQADRRRPARRDPGRAWAGSPASSRW